MKTLSAEQWAVIARQLGNAQPARDELLVSFGKSVADRREHEHPTWEDLFCMNLSAYMGERMAPVLRRLLDVEAALERRTSMLHDVQEIARARTAEARGRDAYGRRLKAENAELRHKVAELEADPAAASKLARMTDAEDILSTVGAEGAALDAHLPELERVSLESSGGQRRAALREAAHIAEAEIQFAGVDSEAGRAFAYLAERYRSMASELVEKDTRSAFAPHTGESTQHSGMCEYPDVRPCLCPVQPRRVGDPAESVRRAHQRSRIGTFFVAARWSRTVRAAKTPGGAG